MLTRILYGAGNVHVGRNLRADGLPRILIDPGATLEIGDDVELRSGVEIRVHGKARVSIERGSRIDRGVRILAANEAQIHIHEGARIGLYSVLNGGDSIAVGRKALLSGYVYLQTSMHAHGAPGVAIQDQGYLHAPVVLGDDAWLGTHAVIMPGVTVGKGAIVGSNAVVTKDVDALNVVAGVPAKVIKKRG